MERIGPRAGDNMTLTLLGLTGLAGLALFLVKTTRTLDQFRTPEAMNQHWHHLSCDANRVVLTPSQVKSWISPTRSLSEIFKRGELLGQGTDGLVWMVKDQTGRIFALKRFTSHKMAELELVQGLKTSHPNVVRTFQCTVKKSADGTLWPYLLMEYVEGETLNLQKLLPEERCSLLIEAASSLSDLLKERIAPADIWSENILITPAGHWKWIDLGGFVEVPSEGIRLRQLELMDYLLRALAPYTALRNQLQAIYQECCNNINFTQLLLGIGRVGIWRAEHYLSAAIDAVRQF